ncbi:hypothetical protein BaRGS_00040128 [Batillaria attramentaria]|uniref:Uncharacterized protein n=1 Tax=Batillaria attramentaria TaxID=370345 RepID=A0ABD0J191_9CAEN
MGVVFTGPSNVSSVCYSRRGKTKQAGAESDIGTAGPASSVASTRALPASNHAASDDSSHTGRTKSLVKRRYTSISSVSLSMASLASFSIGSCRGHAMFPETSILTPSGFPTHSVRRAPLACRAEMSSEVLPATRGPAARHLPSSPLSSLSSSLHYPPQTPYFLPWCQTPRSLACCTPCPVL